MSKKEKTPTIDPEEFFRRSMKKQIRELYQKYPPTTVGTRTEADLANDIEFLRKLERLSPEKRRVIYHALPHLARLANMGATDKVCRNFERQIVKILHVSNDDRLKRDVDAAARRAKVEGIKGGKADPVPTLKNKFTL